MSICLYDKGQGPVCQGTAMEYSEPGLSENSGFRVSSSELKFPAFGGVVWSCYTALWCNTLVFGFKTMLPARSAGKRVLLKRNIFIVRCGRWACWFIRKSPAAHCRYRLSSSFVVAVTLKIWSSHAGLFENRPRSVVDRGCFHCSKSTLSVVAVTLKILVQPCWVIWLLLGGSGTLVSSAQASTASLQGE